MKPVVGFIGDSTLVFPSTPSCFLPYVADPTGEMREEELLQEELAKRMKIQEEERRKRKEETRKLIEAE